MAPVLATSRASVSSRIAARTLSESRPATSPSMASVNGRPATDSAFNTARASASQPAARAVSSSANRGGRATDGASSSESVSPAATSCSVKNGCPSARAYTSSTNPDGGGTPTNPLICSATSVWENGPRRISSTPASRRTCVSQSATAASSDTSSLRQVTTSRTPVPRTARIR
jgi:hypothetical protein